MQKFWAGGLVLVLLVAVRAVTLAQQPPSPEGPFGGPPPGGFRLPNFGPPGFGPPGMIGPPEMQNNTVTLLGIPEVQEELALSLEQKEAILAANRELQRSLQEAAVGTDFETLEKLTPEEREKKLTELRTKLESELQASEKKQRSVLQPEQDERLTQLRLQRDGGTALQQEDVVAKLKITEEQLKRIGELAQRGVTGFGPPQLTPQLKADLLDVLTPEQRTTWTSLTGKEFNFPATRNQAGFGRGPGGGPPGFGGPGGMWGPERKLLALFDQNKDGWLNLEERKVARTTATATQRHGPGGPGGGPPGMGRGNREPGKPGLRVSPSDVAPTIDASLYDPKVVRTIFLAFENPDWETELEAFHGSDVDVPATLIVDGRKLEGVGVHYRGMSSYGMVPTGSKRSLNVSLDLVNSKQRLYGYKTLNLLNGNGDPTFLSTVLYSQIARQYIPAPKANFVRVVINGESWGLYTNAQQFDKIFLAENYQSEKGTRWKVPGSPGGRSGLEYTGDNVADYKERYEIKSSDNEKSWQALIKLCKTLNETPPDQLEAAIAPMLDIDGALWFLALDCALQNSDGYWTRASDYSICLDEQGKFHIIPHDMNETFHAAGGPGMGPGGPGGFGPPGGGRGFAGGRPPGAPGMGSRGGGFNVDPLVGLTDNSKPLRSKLLAVPSLREKYLQHVKTIAEEWLDWQKVGPIVADYRTLIEKEVETDTRKLSTTDEFRRSLSAPAKDAAGESRGGSNLFTFAKQRREFLLNHSEIKALK